MAHITFDDRTDGRALAHWGAPAREGFLKKLAAWQRRYRDRRDLARLLQVGSFLDRDLRDLGVSRGQLEFEAGKPFWRA